MEQAMVRRPTHPMPADIRAALKTGRVEAAYRERPHYQRNDYVGWIARSKLDATRKKRIAQMIAELKKGGVYMRMKHAPSAKAR
jgi:uncharacterized protein YdeI (YjbR/CyaY-like superfamily)